MLPLPKRGNAPQTLCHRAFPTMMLPRYLILQKTLNNRQCLIVANMISYVQAAISYNLKKISGIFSWNFQNYSLSLPLFHADDVP